MALRRLEAILKPPLGLAEIVRPEIWEQVERDLGTALPDDYKRFVSIYGTGRIDQFLWIFTPTASSKYINLVEANRAYSQLLDEARKWDREYDPYDLYPAPGGLLAFGATDNGNVLYWKTRDAPSQWTVVAYQSRGLEHFDFNGSMSEFLAALLSREITCNVFPADFPSVRPTFVPVDMI
jgi:hypothetical protein